MEGVSLRAKPLGASLPPLVLARSVFVLEVLPIFHVSARDARTKWHPRGSKKGKS